MGTPPEAKERRGPVRDGEVMAGSAEVRAIQRNVRISAKKVRLVMAVIRGKSVNEAMTVLRFLPHKAAVQLLKAVKSASANAENNFHLEPEDLVITQLAADDARQIKRYRPRARGRANQILKRSTHITVVVKEREA